jgi:Fe2+ or Zn2+ uptake regulation protein
MIPRKIQTPESALAETSDIFIHHGLRRTRQRERIYEALAASKAHPTAEELYEQVRRDAPGLSLATVYNTLDAFCKAGLCLRLPSANGSGPCRFDAETTARVHVALDDGRVLDAPIDISERMLASLSQADVRDLESRLGIRVAKIQVQLLARLGGDPA